MQLTLMHKVVNRLGLKRLSAAGRWSIKHAQTKLILSSRFALLNVILKSIFGALECDSQKHILIA
ncbi:hypothetical protein SynBIOSE41_03144 [Synechococcus sp. BIOS-E4-1]|uniref:hypothetical protein n=1 Tax=Synechococcus sp. BIOS-E4-1 TaxID=1400864 RepID=UPI00186138F2|nr:hypothetical protein [Synechococcus sp. BIOS-E4-1]QNI55627.1 hypothetical protein SynBIOSE41_03144 [Synechococcus sp. BIOS-E4-1]